MEFFQKLHRWEAMLQKHVASQRWGKKKPNEGATYDDKTATRFNEGLGVCTGADFFKSISFPSLVRRAVAGITANWQIWGWD